MCMKYYHYYTHLLPLAAFALDLVSVDNCVTVARRTMDWLTVSAAGKIPHGDYYKTCFARWKYI